MHGRQEALALVVQDPKNVTFRKMRRPTPGKGQIGDDTILWFGRHKGKALADVPDEYLLWLYENQRSGMLTGYITENLESIKKNAKQ